MTIVLWILGLIFFIAVLMVSVAGHEASHMLMAKKFKGLTVPKFSVGFGKELWGFDRKGTRYSLRMIPLGGFVVIEDNAVSKPEVSDLEEKSVDETLTEEERKKASKELKKRMESYKAQKGLLSFVAPWKRIMIYLAGPAFNVVVGIGIIFAVLMTFPTAVVDNTVESVNDCEIIGQHESCEAGKAGIEVGDTIVAVNGESVRLTEDLYPHLAGRDSVELTVQRGDELVNIESGLKNEFLGVNLTLDHRPLNFVESVETVENVMVQTLISISELPSKVPAVAEQTFMGADRHPESPSSLVHVGKTYGDTTADQEIPAQSRIQMLLTYTGLINLSLGLLNGLIPLLPLDAGRVLIAVIDQFKIWFARLFKKAYKPVGEWEVAAMTMTTGLAVMAFMGLLMLSDVVGIFRGQI